MTQTKTKKICCAGLNPSWQKTIFFNGLKYGGVNRAVSVSATASGKGINFVRAVNTWDLCSASVCQFVGGATGLLLENALDEEGIKYVSTKINAETRICSTLVHGNGSGVTEIIEPSPRLSNSEILDMREKTVDAVEASDALAICGTYPADAGKTFYRDLASAARSMGKMLFIDSFSGIESTLQAGATGVLKINLDELKALTGENSVETAFAACLSLYDIKILAVTDGASDAYISDGKSNIVRLPVPKIDHVVNPIGSGDTCSGVMLSELLSGTAPIDAFRLGLAAASANCLSENPACFQKSKALELAGVK